VYSPLGRRRARYWDVFWKAATKARKENGAKIIVIDPRGIDSARQADLWLQIRPGTDCALALAMINHILQKGLYNKIFVERWCYGLNAIRDRAAEYPLDKVAEITWVPAEKIQQAAEWYATLTPGVTNHGMGIEHLPSVIERFTLTSSCQPFAGISMKKAEIFCYSLPRNHPRTGDCGS